MLRYGLSNLRRLKNIKPIELRPITLLVGRNSSGKSSFLRTLPLFRQSITTRTNSPILWYGDLVDFGSFDVSVSSADKGKPIKFDYILDTVHVSPSRSYMYYEDRRREANTFKDVETTLHISPIERRTYISLIKITIANPRISYEMAYDSSGRLIGLIYNGENVFHLLGDIVLHIGTGALFPDLRPLVRPTSSIPTRGPTPWPSEHAQLFQKAFDLYRKPLNKVVGDKTLSDFLVYLFQNAALSEQTFQEAVSRVSGKKFKSFLDEICDNDSNNLLPELKKIMAVRSLPAFVGAVSAQLRAIFGSTLYIGPARARSERYYRYQDFSVSEIDPDGKNFPMFLNSLNRRQRQNLSDWITTLFGYGINVTQESGHISIRLVEKRGEVNIVDVGYGVSQILPVLAQIWWSRSRPQTAQSSRLINLLAVEQPELHLHPAHQALLADALVGEASLTVSGAGRQPRATFIVETHSETLINRLGELISRNKISASDVQIILFEQDTADDSATAVRTVEYDSDGILIDWPFGFFQPEIA